MSWQTMEAVRDHSESRGATRTVAFVLASYADKYGRDIYISLKRLMVEAKVGRKAAVDGRRWLVENGEAELVDRPDGVAMMKGRVRVMSMRPLMERARLAEQAATEDAEGSPTELIDKGSDTEPQAKEGSPTEPLGVRSGAQGVRSAPPIGSASEPDTEGNGTETEDEPEVARASARASIPVFEHRRTDTQRAAEQHELEREIESLNGQLASSGFPEVTQRAIETLQGELAELREGVAA